MDSDLPTKLSKFPTPFSIESLIATQHQAVQENNNRSVVDAGLSNNNDLTDELSARAMVASSALGLTNFPLYNPWLHGYFAQNHDRISQLLAVNGDYMANSLLRDQHLKESITKANNIGLNGSNSPPLNCKVSPDPETQLQQTRFLIPGAAFGLGAIPSSAALNDTILQQSATLGTDLTSRQRLAEIMANGLTTENVQNLSINSRFANNSNSMSSSSHNGKQDAAPGFGQHPSEEGSVDVVDDDYDCSGDSCSDISLTMSPQNYRNEMDKNKGNLNYNLCRFMNSL